MSKPLAPALALVGKSVHKKYKNYEITKSQYDKLINYFLNKLKSSFLPRDVSRDDVKKLWIHIFNKLPDNSLRKIYIYQLLVMNFNIGIQYEQRKSQKRAIKKN